MTPQSDPHSASTVEMMRHLRQALRSESASRSRQGGGAKNPLVTFLVGAGFSVSAGLPTTAHLVRCLREFSHVANPTWAEILDATLETDDELPCDVTEYSRLMAEVLSLPAARRDFISACVRWGTGRQAPISEESILLGAMLRASTYGGVPLTERIRLGAADTPPLAPRFARHVFTTNFDEVLPLAFHLSGHAVEVIDEGSLRRVEMGASYPTVVYLHGRHLHYDMKNTAEELRAARRSSSLAEEPVEQFRRVLRSTGLVIIGYSGGEDRVVDAIEDAIGDASSLPYGLWWASYPSAAALSPRARGIVASSERARFLEPGMDAERLMRSLTHEIGIQEASVLNRWLEDLARLRTSISAIMIRSPVRLRRFHSEVQEALSAGDDAAMKGLLRRWDGLSARVDELEDRSLAGDILASMNFAHFFYGNPADAIDTATRALAAFEAIGDPAACADQQEALALAFLSGDRLEEARAHATAAVRMHGALNDVSGLAYAHTLLSTVLVEAGQTKEAQRELDEAMGLYESLGDQAGIASVSHDLGLRHKEAGRQEDAKTHLQRAFEIARDLGDAADIGDYGHDLAALLAETEDYERAEEVYQLALAACEQGGNWAAAATLRTAFSDVFIATEQLASAEVLLKQALRTGRQHDDREIIRYAAGSLGIVYLGMGRIEDAERLLSEAAASRNQDDCDALDVESLATARALLGKSAEALSGFRDAERLYASGEDWEAAAHAASCLAGLLDDLGQHGQATAAMGRARGYSLRARGFNAARKPRARRRRK